MTSTLSAEHTVVGTRSRLIVSVFFALTLGSLTAGIVFVVLLAAFKSSIYANIDQLEWVWRLLLGLGIIPAVFTLYARLKMKETKPYEQCKLRYTRLRDIYADLWYNNRCCDGNQFDGQWKKKLPDPNQGFQGVFLPVETCKGLTCHICMLVPIVRISPHRREKFEI